MRGWNCLPYSSLSSLLLYSPHGSSMPICIFPEQEFCTLGFLHTCAYLYLTPGEGRGEIQSLGQASPMPPAQAFVGVGVESDLLCTTYLLHLPPYLPPHLPAPFRTLSLSPSVSSHNILTALPQLPRQFLKSLPALPLMGGTDGRRLTFCICVSLQGAGAAAWRRGDSGVTAWAWRRGGAGRDRTDGPSQQLAPAFAFLYLLLSPPLHLPFLSSAFSLLPPPSPTLLPFPSLLTLFAHVLLNLLYLQWR